jgi:hypothetical protein
VDEEREQQGTPPPSVPPPGAPSDGTSPSWDVPPGADASPDRVEVSYEEADGPPPPPFVRERRRRRRRALAITAALVVVAIPIGLAVASGLAERDEPAASSSDDEDAAAPSDDEEPEIEEAPDDGTDEDGPDDPSDESDGEAAPAPDVELDPLDLDGLDGLDAVYGQLLTDIDASERTMIGFQEDLADALGGLRGPDEMLDDASEVAAASRVELLEVRDRLAGELGDDGAERVRELYVEHLDSWADYMAAVEDDPLVIVENDGSFTVAINATADAFARALEAELPDDIDAEVERFADGILDRGFRGMGQADV